LFLQKRAKARTPNLSTDIFSNSLLERSVLVGRLKSGSLAPQTLVWHEGMPEWKSAFDTDLLREAAPAPTPVPTRSAFTQRSLSRDSNPYNVYGTSTNNSGCGPETDVPKEACGLFNVGAFLYPSLWSYSMGMETLGRGIFLFNLLSFRWCFLAWPLKLPLCVYLGFAGNRLAWQHRHFSDVEEFKKTQFLWATISAGVMSGSLVLCALIYIWLVGQAHQYNAAQHAVNFPSGQTSSVSPTLLPPDTSQPFGPPPPSAP